MIFYAELSTRDIAAQSWYHLALMLKKFHLPAAVQQPWPMSDQPGDGSLPPCAATLLRSLTSNPAHFSGVFFQPAGSEGAF